MNGEQARLLTPGQVAALLVLTAETVRRWARTGKLPGVVKMGGRRGVLRFNEQEILRFIERRRRD